MSVQENKALVRRMTEEFWNTGNMDVVEDFFSADLVSHGATGDMDLAQFKQSAEAYFAGFPDLHITTDDLIAEGDQVVKRWTAHVTHTGEYLGVPATGNKITVTGLEVYRIKDGKICENWLSMDAVALLQGIGVIPPLG
jgi:steroid delta-isomerase-like uncharacterized protein